MGWSRRLLDGLEATTFQTDSGGHTVFFPEGFARAGFIIDTPARERRIRRFVGAFMVTSIVPVALGVSMGPAVWIPVLFLLLASYEVVVHRLVKGLVRSTARPRVTRGVGVLVGIGVLLLVMLLVVVWGGRAIGLWGPRAGQATLPPAAAWKSLESADGGFAIEFPGDPEAYSEDVQGITAHTLTLSTPDGHFFVGWFDVPGVEADYGPATARERATAMSATIVSEGDTEVGGLPGYEFVLAVPTDCASSIPGPCRVTSQMLPVGTRVYNLVTAVPDPPGASPLTDRFFESFKPRT
jgi:hypothetical protein